MSGRLSSTMLACAALVLLGAMATPALAASRASEVRTLRGLAIREQNNSLRYLHTTWFEANYHYQTVPIASITEASGTAGATGTIELLSPALGFSPASSDQAKTTTKTLLSTSTSAGPVVGSTREQASASYATALALANGTYDPSQVGVSATEALRRTVAWTNALALSHARGQWGQSWQSPLWAFYLGAGSTRIWSSLPTCTQELVTAAVTQEANRLLKTPPVYYRNAAGRIVSPGDSKSEENAWDATLLFLAVRMYASGNPSKAAQWEAQGRWYALTAYATRDQVGTDPRIQGSNLNNNGSVTNHGVVNPDYMATAGEMQVKYMLTSAWTSTPEAPECLNRFTKVWAGLAKAKFSVRLFRKPGGTIYRAARGGVVTSRLYYPQGPGWSATRRHNMALMDVAVFVAGHNYAYGWARVHINYVLRQQARHRDGRVFSAGETRFNEDEQFAATCAAEMVEALKLVR